MDENNSKKTIKMQLKIEIEKTKQLELLKDIKRIEKSIKEKELYLKRNNSVCLTDLLKKNKKHTSNSESESEIDSELENESISDSDSDCENYNKNFIRECINIRCKKNVDYDSLSLSSVDSNYNYEDEINIK